MNNLFQFQILRLHLLNHGHCIVSHKTLEHSNIRNKEYSKKIDWWSLLKPHPQTTSHLNQIDYLLFLTQHIILICNL